MSDFDDLFETPTRGKAEATRGKKGLPRVGTVYVPEAPEAAPGSPGKPGATRGSLGVGATGTHTVNGRGKAEASQKKDNSGLREERDFLRYQLAEWSTKAEHRKHVMAPHAGAYQAAYSVLQDASMAAGLPPREDTEVRARLFVLYEQLRKKSAELYPHKQAVAEAERMVKEVKRVIKIINEELA